MANCEYMDVCDYYNNKIFEELPKMLEVRKNQYCRNDFKNCARYIVTIEAGEKYLPALLLPSQQEKAQAIVLKAQNK